MLPQVIHVKTIDYVVLYYCCFSMLHMTKGVLLLKACLIYTIAVLVLETCLIHDIIQISK